MCRWHGFGSGTFMPTPPRPPVPLDLRPTIARPAPERRSPPVVAPTRNPFKRYWRAVSDADESWGQRIFVAVGVPLALGLGAAGLAVGAFLIYAWSLLPETPDAYALARATRSQPTIVYDVRGERLTQFEPAFREWVPLDSIPVHLVDALIATEDRAFYDHSGVDLRRTVGAIWNTVRGRREGGSTITQQLARNLFPEEIGNAGTVERKTKEAMAARAIERENTKREILEAYLNTVPFLYNAHGVEMAARTYFGTHAPDLTVTQSAMLVAMLKGPNLYNPVRHPEAATARRDLVLRLMAAQGKIDPVAADSFRAEPLGVDLQPQPSTYSAAPHFTAAVRRELDEWATARGYDVDRDGLVVRTTLDLTMQRAAEAAVAERATRLQRTADAQWGRGVPRRALDAALRTTTAYARARDAGADAEAALATVRDDAALVDSTIGVVRRVEAALVAIQPETGAVRAYVGSRDFRVDEYDHAGVALRQPGSTFKAFVYAGALQRGYAPEDTLGGGSAEVELDDGTTWRPAGGSTRGTLADALAFSKNAATARLTQEVGAHRVALVARRMGVTSDLDVVPSIGLGTSPVTLLEMVSAYGTIANDGLRREPRLITRIETASGTVLDSFGGTGNQALTRRDARNLLDMLRGVVERGTGRPLREMGATGDLAGKTGTTQDYADGWFIAMRPGLAVGAWVGFNDQRVTFRSKQTGEGSRTALPVVGDFLLRVQDRLPDVSFPPPPGRYQALDIDPDGDSLLVDEPSVADVTPDDYEWAFGEDPSDPAPIDAPEVVRPVEEKPDLRQPPPSSRRIGWGGDGQRADPPTEAPAPTRNPNNRGGMTAEEMIERAKEDG
ncbi:MAG: penicillin-binding protein [Rhodothermaceae bacterium]|nr:penicillin-binding protein [Rhodothermaceae bacterium]MBC13801.1 penicillin-binding protein [Rhodothermaceae bacterium]